MLHGAIAPLILASLPSVMAGFLKSECRGLEVLAVGTSNGVELSYYGNALGVRGDDNIDRVLADNDPVAIGHCHVYTAEQYAVGMGGVMDMGDVMDRFSADVLDNRVLRWQPSLGDMKHMLKATRLAKGSTEYYILDAQTSRLIRFGLTPEAEKKYRRAKKYRASRITEQLLGEYKKIKYELNWTNFAMPPGDEPSLDKLIERTKGTSFFIEDLGIYQEK
jgi:hypothetical protein